MPVELVHEILSYLSNDDIRNLLKLHSSLYGVCMRILHRTLTVPHDKALGFLEVTGDPSSNLVSFIKYLTLSMTHSIGVGKLYDYLRVSLPRMELLHTLNITLSPQRSNHAFHLLYHPLLEENIPDSGINTFGKSIFNLPNLKVLGFHGDIRLARIIYGNGLTTIHSSVWMYDERMSLLLACAKSGNHNTSVTDLHIRIGDDLGDNIKTFLPILSKVFANIKDLSILSPKVSAIEALETLAFGPSVFPKLSNFRLNDWARGPEIRRWLSEEYTKARLMALVDEIKLNRPSLVLIVLGTCNIVLNGTFKVMECVWAPYILPTMTSSLDLVNPFILHIYFEAVQMQESPRDNLYLFCKARRSSEMVLQYIGTLEDSGYYEDDDESFTYEPIPDSDSVDTD